MVYPLVNVYITMENHHFLWENPLFLWPFSIATLNYQRVSVFLYHQCVEDWRCSPSSQITIMHPQSPTSPFYPRSFSTIFPSYPDDFPIISFMIFSFYPNDPPITEEKKRHDFPCLLHYSQRYHHVFHVTIGFILGFTTVSPHDTPMISSTYFPCAPHPSAECTPLSSGAPRDPQMMG